jgi:hypothetical protein
MSPLVRADTFLVDTTTGRMWTRIKFSDAVGEPEIWISERRFDTQTEVDLFTAIQTPKAK